MTNNSALSESKSFRFLDVIMVVYVLLLVLSNIASSAKIIDWGVNLGSIPLSFDAGTLLFPVSYVIGDVMTEVYGFKRTRRIIWIGFGALIFSALAFKLVQIMPGEETWQASIGQESYDKILGSISSGSIILASLAGYLAGSFSNSIMMSALKLLSKGQLLWVRTISSTLVGEALDTFSFILVATALGVFPWSLFLSLAITNYIFKVGIEVAITPLTYWAVSSLKKLEGVDIFDKGISLSPFKFK